MNGRRPPDAAKWRMPLRVAAVAVAYLLYRLPGDDRLFAGLGIGIGFLLLAFPTIDRYTLPGPRRSRLLETGTILLGLGFIGAGLLMAVR